RRPAWPECRTGSRAPRLRGVPVAAGPAAAAPVDPRPHRARAPRHGRPHPAPPHDRAGQRDGRDADRAAAARVTRAAPYVPVRRYVILALLAVAGLLAITLL